MIQNPVFRKEMLVRFRLRPGATAQLGVVIAIGIGIALFHWLFIRNMLDARVVRGKEAWQWLVGIQYAIICLMTPAIAANAITQEREQQTWDMLIFTRLKPSEIIMGKLFGRMIPTFALLALCFPLTLCCMIVSYMARDGSWRGFPSDYNQEVVAAGQFLGTYVVMLVTALFYTTLGLFLSYRTRRTLYALMGSYTTVIGGLLIGTGMITVALSSIVHDYRFSEHFFLLWINPAYMIAQAISPFETYGTAYLIGGLTIYIALTALMLSRMILGFRRFSVE